MSELEAKELSAEEVKQAKAELAEGVEDEFVDATEDGKEKTFDVSPEELSIIRAELACEFPDDYDYMSDDYIMSVASKPYSKDLTVRRPLEYTMEKLSHVMEWREESGAVEMLDKLVLANGPDTATEAVEDPDRFAKAKAMAASLNYGSMYWHGLDKEGRPVLWIRCNRMPWYPDVEAQVNALILLADTGIRSMPKGVTDFVVISESNSPPPPNPQFMINILKALVRGYPDRLALLVSAPVGTIIQFIMKLLIPLMPGRLASKIVLEDLENGKAKLTEMLLNGEDDIPTFMGGTNDHDALYPTEGYCPNRGQGCLKFDFYGMKERLEKQVKEYTATKD
uniref:CRAL-TRIO domain-containing protein n=1 Tax=Eucampia antarctica TaxID=49252 RepID=A0A7S2RL89_9STRA|mmetsp:Transcript_23771/g.22807  ORF Transcript_23771/g.22807 Transcript_23771/m.22807 type:complete len:338 (+) Transcript_23771:195-1208(+)|eukprot:CAMPEP_0197824536 /NCGR_PEP_ID=MMETSP1437-20131217/1759_1 /TAXON_ID=49252 ORGANISM="Eucampia antarctica, Strain CCMP1452" /NCGR_SAMPLE_ID=MMETSP1437 /ASSEMBLY_ACC=CAM_ASM_001096 /LENGTH=337 /DNA_ID=CAMNT_0043424191 /DNA_START=195 /DNA_END=1208 /DNA_ORIENTATION=+